MTDTMEMRDLQTSGFLEALGGAIADGRRHADQNRRVDDDLMEAARTHGLFSLLTPKPLGGAERDLTEVLRLIERLAYLDGSFAWNVWNANIGFIGALLSPEGQQAIWHDGIQPIVVNSARVTGQAMPTDDGYLLHGRWDLVSGILHADWVGLFAIVMDGESPRFTPAGRPDVRLFLCPVSSIEIVDTWNVSGMRGTGSNTVVATGLPVPETLAVPPMGDPNHPTPLYRIPPFTLASTGIAGVLVGMARAAIDSVRELSVTKTSDNGAPLASRPRVRVELARSTAALDGAWLGVLAASQAVDEAAATPPGRGGGVSAELRARLRAAMCHAAEVASEVTTAMYRIGSSASIYHGNEIEQIFRDVHAASQHGLLNVGVYELAGTVMLGGEPDAPMF